MTLREIGQSISDYWNGYYTTVTTANIVDWNLSYILITVVGAIFAFQAALFATLLTAEYLRIAHAYRWINRKLDSIQSSWLQLVLIFFGAIFLLMLLAALLGTVEYLMQ